MDIDVYEQVFFWIGVISSGFFITIGMSVFATWVMNRIWVKFKDGKELANLMMCWRENKDKYQNKT